MDQSLSAIRVATLVGTFPRSPAYAGLAETLRVLIGDGRIASHVRLPSERELTAALDVSRTTVTKAYDVLRDSGYAEARRGAGTFTRVPGGPTRARDQALTPLREGSEVIDLNCAVPSAPPGVAQAYAQGLEALPAYLSGHGLFPQGVPEVQTAVAEQFDARGLPTAPGQVMITPGALAAVAIVARAITRPRDRILVESPTYPNATRAFRSSQARLVPGHVDPDGWDLEAMVGSVRQSSAKAAYLVPDFQNPTGHLMRDADREWLAGQLRRAGTLPVIDEAHQALALEDDLATTMPRPFAAYDDRAVTIGSASKSHWGGLRLGWIRAPEAMMERLLDARVGLDLGAPPFEQLVLARLLERGEVVQANRVRLRQQRDALAEAVAEHLPDWQHRPALGGLSMWCELPEARGTAVAAEGVRRGVAITPGPVFALEGGLNRFVRIPWTRPAAELVDGVRRLAAAWQHVRSTQPGPSELAPGRVLVP